MNPLIEFCEQNLASGTAEIAEQAYFQEMSDIVTYSCLNECVLCAQRPFAIFEGELVTATSVAELEQALRQLVEEWHHDM